MFFGKKKAVVEAAPEVAPNAAQEEVHNKEVAQKSLKRMNAWMAFGLVGIIAISAYVVSIFAAQIDNTRDQMSNQATATGANHDISFNLSGGNTFMAAEEIAVDFPHTSAFLNGGAWAVADFSFNDGTSRTIAAVNEGPGVSTVVCADAADDVGIAVDTTSLIFRVIPCGPSFTSSGAGAFINFSIDGAPGNGELVNPVDTGSYIIEVIDGAGDCQTLGDFCKYAVPIINTNDIQVSAQVISGGGGGGGGGGGDTTPPTIFNINYQNADEDSVEVCWETNEGADGTVNWGLTNSYGNQDSHGGYLFSHCVEIGPLVEGETYDHQICSEDSAGNQVCTGNLEYTLPDNTAPIISNVSVNSVSCASANFTWTTNEPSTSYVDRGLVAGPPYANTAGTSTPVTTHNVLITGLTQGTTYHYRVRSGDSGGNEAFTSNATFATTSTCENDTTPPIITNIQENNITQTSAQICWETNEIANGVIVYGPTVSYGETQTDNNYVLQRCFNLTGLLPGTVYHYQLTSTDPSSNQAQTTDLTFTTVPAEPGQCVVDCTEGDFYPYIVNPDGTVRKVGSAYVQETQETPTRIRYNFEDKGTDMDFDDVIVTVEKANCSSVTFSADLGDAAWHHVIRAEVYYQGELRKDVLLWSDSHNAENAPVMVNFANDTAMCEGTPPDITNVRATGITQTTAIISWDTLGSPSNSRVEYGTTPAYGQVAFIDDNVTEHSVVLSGLTKGTLYYFRVLSEDNAGREAVSSQQSFTTVADTTAPANVANLAAEAGNAQVNLTWTNPGDADFQGVRIYRKSTGYSTGVGDGDLIYTGNGTSFLDATVTNGVTYYYTLYSFDDVPNFSSGALANATPSGAPDVTPPADVTNLEATAGDAQVLLTWTNPNNVDFQGVRIVRKVGSAPTGISDGDVVYVGPNSAFVDTGVTNGTHYFYRVFAYDEVPNYSAGAVDDATPSATADTTAPDPVTNLVATAGDAQVLLTWTNPSTPDWAGTIVVRKTGSYPTSPSDGTIVFDGIGSDKMDNFVTNGTRYYYAAFAYDGVPNYAPPATDDATPQAGLPQPENPSCADTDGGRNYDTGGTVTYQSAGSTDSCADGVTLIEHYCQNDQPAQESHNCGSGYRCSTDRCVPEAYVPSTEVCGNGQCGGDENSLNCAIDCPVLNPEPPVPEVPVTVDEDLKMEPTDLRFYATAGRIQLRLRNGDTLRFYRSSVFTVMIPDPSIKSPIARAWVTFDGKSYAMRQTASFEATIITPDKLETIPMTVAVEYANGQTDQVDLWIELVDRPRIVDSVTGQPVAGARVTLMTNETGDWGVFDGNVYSQQNPQFTDDLGRFGYIVPIGSYSLIVEKEGYRTRETLPFPNSTDNVIVTSVELIPLPPPDDIPAQIEYVGEVIKETIKELIDNAYVEQGAGEIAAPAATIATIANVAAAGVATASVFFLPSYLLSLLAHPFMLLARRRRKQWGVVYNALSKLPIDLAIVRLIDARTGRILRSAVTDKAGRYFFIVQPGAYKIVAVKASYVFPSDSLRGVKEDSKYVDLYHGEVIEVSKETTITANIPLDPIGAEKTPSRLRWENALRGLQRWLGVFAILAMVVATVIDPRPLMFALLIGNIVLYMLFRRMAVAKKPKNWGIVYDEKSKKPLPNVVARIFDSRYNKLLETQVTDARGRYAFLVGQNTYYVTFEKLGYQKTQKGPVDLVDTTKTQSHLVAVDVPLTYTGVKGSGGPVARTPFTGPGAPPQAPPPMPAMPPQPQQVPPAPPAAPPPAPAPAKPAASSKGDYAAQMMARLGGSAAAAKPPASPSEKPKPSETPEQLMKDIADEISGARNGHELPSPEQAHPEEGGPATDKKKP